MDCHVDNVISIPPQFCRYYNNDMIMSLLREEKSVDQLNYLQIQSLPPDVLRYVITNNLSCSNLLNIWHLLPTELQSDHQMRILLPCYIHYNRPEPSATHFDGFPIPQVRCSLCKLTKKLNTK